VAWRAVIILFLGLASAPAAAAEVRYVTDRLLLGLYEAPDASTKSQQTLVSGTPLEVLETTKHYARVRTPEGTEGWVKSAFLVAEEPPRLAFTRLQEEKQALDRHLQTTLKELEVAQKERARLAAELETTGTTVTKQSEQLSALERTNARYRARLNREQPTVPLYWALAGSVLALSVGAVVTQRVIDFRIRRRHGGFRIH